MKLIDDEQLMYRLAVHSLPGIGPITARNLISYCGGVKEVFSKRKSLLEKIPGIGPERIKDILSFNDFSSVQNELAYLKKNDVQCLFYLDEKYPARLKNCDDAPILLFYKGNEDLNKQKIISIVGTRHMTSYGKESLEKIVHDLSSYNPLIISGLAYGVDIHAHKMAMKYGLKTIGVVAHGIGKIYPAENASTAEKMISEGGILTEYFHKTKPERENFPARNRIVAGMSDAVLVIESAIRGGALITAEFANSYNRDVFALPGKTTDQYSKGCHLLIKKNKASIFESADDIADAMNWKIDEVKKTGNQLLLFNNLTPDEKTIVETLTAHQQLSVDQLAIHTLFPVSKTSSLLLNLEFAGIIKVLPGRIFKINGK